MDKLYNIELFYIAGIGLLLNFFLFATTWLMYLCKPQNENTDLEALDHLEYHDDNLNVALLHENDDQRKQNEKEEKGLRLINLIPAMKFIHVSNKDRESNCENGCSICLREGYEDDEMCKVLPECNHVFHSYCIDQWLKKNQSCPVCRKIFRVVLPKV